MVCLDGQCVNIVIMAVYHCTVVSRMRAHYGLSTLFHETTVIDNVNVEVITAIAIAILCAFKLICTSVVVLILFSIAVDVVRFISLTILIPPGHPSVSHQTNDSNNDIDKIEK